MSDFSNLYNPTIESTPLSGEPKLTELINPFENYDPATMIATRGSGGKGVFDDFARRMGVASMDSNLETYTYDPIITNEARFKQSDYSAELGFDPFRNNEFLYGSRQTWGDVLGNAIGGGVGLAAQTFTEGWKGWGNMVDALFSWDASKLVGSDEQLLENYQQQQELMNKYAIFSTPESEEGIFNRQFFGNMLQQGGFALGALAQMASEELLTFGASTAFTLTKGGANLARMGKVIARADAINDLRKLNGLSRSSKIMYNVAKQAEKFIPLVGVGNDLSRYGRAGAGALELGLVGLGGVRRSFSEANMAFSEARMEAAGTFGDLYKRLQNDYKLKDTAPSAQEEDRMKAVSREAAQENFFVNAGILAVSNRIQFDNLFTKFGNSRQILKNAGQFGDDFFSVTGKTVADGVEKQQTQVFRKGLLGRAGAFGEIAETFGTRTARWEAAKGLGKGLMKWEFSEGIQELAQETSNATLQDYYYDLYHGTKGYSLGRSLDKALDQSVNSMQGFKTFLMGAVTGRLLSPISFGVQKGLERMQLGQEGLDQRDADKSEIQNTLNNFYKDPKKVLNEAVANFKVQESAAIGMQKATADRDQYAFHNYKDSAFSKLVSAAIKTDMLPSLTDTIREYGDDFTPEEFKEAFAMDPEKFDIRDPRQYFNVIADRVESFAKKWEYLNDRYADLVMPDLLPKDSDEYKMAVLNKMALDHAIEILASTNHKAERALVRAQEILNKAISHKKLGPSSLKAFQTLGDQSSAAKELTLLESELKVLQSTPVTDKATKELIAKKQQELDALKNWVTNWDEYTRRDYAGRRKQEKGLRGFADYLSLKNKEQGIDTNVNYDDIQNHYEMFVDYIELNKDHKDFIEAYNVLASPGTFSRFHGQALDALVKTSEKLEKENTAEVINEKTETEDETDGIDLSTLLDADPVTAPAVTAEPSLTYEAFLQQEYQRVANALQADGKTADSFEDWKAKNDNKFTKERYQRQYGKPQTTENVESTTEEGTQTPVADVVTQAQVGPYTIELGDKINDQEVVEITTDTITLEKAGKKSYSAILNLLKPFKGANLIKGTDAATLDDTEQFDDGEIEKVELSKEDAERQAVNKMVTESNPEIYGNSDKVINGATKINNKSDNYKWSKGPGKDRVRTGPNPNYPMILGTAAINPGTTIYLRAAIDMESFEEYEYEELDNTTMKSAADYFDADGKVKSGLEEDFPIEIYTIVNDKEVKLGHVPTVKWVTARKGDGETMNVVEFITTPNGQTINNLEIQEAELREIRSNLYNNHNKNTKFVLGAVVNNKSEGKIRRKAGFSKLKEIIHPKTKMGIISRGAVKLSADQLVDPTEEKILGKMDLSGKEGRPVILLETPTGKTMITYVSVPTLAPVHQDLVIEAWKAFHEMIANPGMANTTATYKMVKAVYEANGDELLEGEIPNFNILREYVNNYVTFLSGRPYDPVNEGMSQLNITPEGALSIWSVETKDKEQDSVFAGGPIELTAKLEQVKEKLGKIYYNVKLSSEKAVGINSTDKKTFLSYSNGKLVSSPKQTYNTYMMGILETNLEKGVPVNPSDKNSPLVYFSNPVITFDIVGKEIAAEEQTVATAPLMPDYEGLEAEKANREMTVAEQEAAIKRRWEADLKYNEDVAPFTEKDFTDFNLKVDESVLGKYEFELSIDEEDTELIIVNSIQEGIDKINAKYDAELKALKQPESSTSIFSQAQNDELDLSLDFGQTLFSMAQDDEQINNKSIRTVVDQLQDDKVITKKCK
jgi:hypothetical protein